MMKSVVLSCFYMFKILKPREYYMDINVNSKSLYEQYVATQSSTETTSSKNKELVPLVQPKVSEQNKKIYEKLGLTQEQFIKLCEEFPNIATLTEDKQLDIINKKLTEIKSSETKTTQETEKTQTSPHSSAGEEKLVDNGVFNHKVYSKLSNDEKFAIYAAELAKNKFLYPSEGDKKTIEAWNTLTPEQQKAFIDAEISNLKKSEKELFDEKSIDSFFSIKMTQLQSANSLGVNAEQFSKDIADKKEYAIDALHDYIFGQDENNRSKEQNLYLRENAFLSKAIVDACKKADIGGYVDDEAVEYNLAGSEISQRLKELGKTKEQVELEYLKGKQNLTKEETERLNFLEDFHKRTYTLQNRAAERAKDPSALVNYGRLETLNKTEYGELFNSAQSTTEKSMVLNSYIENTTKSMSPEEKSKFIAELSDELLNDPANLELTKLIHVKALMEANKLERAAMAAEQSGLSPELNAANIEIYKETEELKLIVEAQNKIAETDSKRAESLKINTINNASEGQMGVTLNEAYSGDKSLNVQRANKNRVFTYENPETQKLAIENIKKNSDEKIIAEAAAEADKLHKDYQVEGLKTLTKGSKLATEAANKSEVVTRMSKQNQTEAFKVMKSNIEELYDNDEEAIEQLNTLSDQISKSHKDNQLDMHNEIMQSKYSAVQEHAAANIKDYDPSVQSKAIDTVYETQNEKAIKTVVDNLEKMPPDVQKTEVTRLIGELALNNAISNSELTVNILGGNLTARDLSKLSASQRREYFVKMFDEASPSKKLDMLRNIAASSIGIHKKTIYTIIARFSAPLLKAMVEDGMGKTMIEAGIPLDAVNKIINIMKTSTSNKVIQQRKELEKDSSFTKYFDNQDDKIRVTVPQDLKGAFAANIDRKTLEELKKNNATMFIKS